MDVVKFGGITKIDDMAWGKNFPYDFLKLKFYGQFGKNRP
jgi:hypothetical protein